MPEPSKKELLQEIEDLKKENAKLMELLKLFAMFRVAYYLLHDAVIEAGGVIHEIPDQQKLPT